MIVYAAPEGDEVAVYTRGSAQLVGGEARVALGPTFRKVANPDLGITAQLTPTGAWADLYVVSKSTEELVVRRRDPKADDVSFDYQVWALRIGFEDKAVLQPKRNESKIPSQSSDDAIYAEHPQLRRFAARQRYTAERARIEPLARAVDTKRSLTLENAIGVHDQARDFERIAPPDIAASVARGPLTPRELRAARLMPQADTDTAVTAATTTRAPARLPEVALESPAPSDSQWVAVAEIVEAGDLLVSSPLLGYAMKAPEGTRAGTVVAKALESMSGGSGTIRVLVMSR